MKENESVLHFIKKMGEAITLTLEYHLPNGKDIPDSYRDIFYELYKIYDNGTLEWLCKEPLIQKEAVQGMLFMEQVVTTTEEPPDITAEENEGHES